MNKKKFFFFIIILLFFYIIFNNFFFGNKKFFGEIKNLIQNEQKIIIKKYLFPYKYISELEILIELQQKEIDSKIVTLRDLRLQLNERDKFLSNLLDIKGSSNFYQTKTNVLKLKNNEYKLIEFEQDYLKIKKHGHAKNGSVYIEKVNDNIILLSADGKFQYFKIEDLKNKNFSAQLINSNIKDLIKYEKFYSNSNYGIKDLFFDNNFIYFSFNREVKNECFNTSILRANINYQKLIFEKFFFPEECVLSTEEWFTPHSAGGRMVKYKDKIIFSNGEYLSRHLAQDDKSIFGKILMLDPLKPNQFKIISKGHRNIQGLYVDQENQVILSTEHGPMGGDEVNVNTEFEKNILNFGWPISSYGEHYGYKERIDSHKIYKIAPLYKSHSKYGFVEPIKYFVPSIGISEIVKFHDYNSEEKTFLFGSLGNDPLEGDMSLHIIILDKKYKTLLDHHAINIGGRVRDIINLGDSNYLLSLETSSTLGFLTGL